MDVAELASYLGHPGLDDLRLAGARQGPTAYRFGRFLKFAVSDVRGWIAQQREPSTPPGRPERR